MSPLAKLVLVAAVPVVLGCGDDKPGKPAIDLTPDATADARDGGEGGVIPPTPPGGHVRLVNASPAVGEVDLYAVADDGENAGQVYQIATGLGFGQLFSRDNVVPGTNTVRVFEAGADTGATDPLLEFEITVVLGETWVGAVVDDDATGVDPDFVPSVLELAPVPAPAAGKASIRFVHAATGIAEVDVYRVVAGASNDVEVAANLALGEQSAAVDLSSVATTFGVDTNSSDDDSYPYTFAANLPEDSRLYGILAAASTGGPAPKLVLVDLEAVESMALDLVVEF